MAAVYSLRLFIRAMHNRLAPQADSRELTLRDSLVLVPLVAVIVAFAFYPQFALSRDEGAVTASIAPAKAKTEPVQEARR